LVLSSATAIAALALQPAPLLAVVRLLRSVCNAIEKRALATLASQLPVPALWFDGLQQELTSAATNPEFMDVDPAKYTGATVYQAEHDLPLPYPPIPDDTEGFAGLEDLALILGKRPPRIGHASVVLNLGGGGYDGPAHWFAAKTGCIVHTADPWRRPAKHNEAVQRAVEAAGGADVVASVSVLNVIGGANRQANRLAHIALAKRALKQGGVGYFKVWAGCWPERGTGTTVDDHERGTHQEHAWASTFEAEVAAIFGAANVFTENNRNLIIAVKQ